MSQQIVSALMAHEPMLLDWNSHVFVLNGALFDERVYSDGHRDYIIRKLLLLDPAAGGNGQTAFDMQTDDWAQLKGFLALRIAHKPVEF